jgi:predicted RNA-binding protein with RPS1 domain
VLEDFFRGENVGAVLPGKIVRLTEFGAFVEIFEGVEGLVHVSELSEDHVERPEDHFAVGQEVRVKVIKIDAVEKKIGLSIKAAIGEPDTDSFAVPDVATGDGSATLGDLMDPSIFRTESTEAKSPAESEADADADSGAEDTPES